MDRIEDERICFYLRNRGDIDRWCSLRQEAGRALDAFLRESANQIEGLGSRLGGDVVPRRSLRGGKGSYIRFLRRAWLTDKTVRAAIGLEWYGAGAVFFQRPRKEPAWVSVWINRGAEGGEELASSARKALSGRAKQLGITSGHPSSSYPAWRYQSPKQKEFWKDLAPFRQQIIEDIQLFWEKFSGRLDELLAENGG